MSAGLVRRLDAPRRRPLRIFAFDPMGGAGELSALQLDVENERLDAGPAGARVVVVDYDASRDVYYPPVDLDDANILMQGGLQPSEADPRFHQQMVYAVALTVLENFDRALGRRITFGPRRVLRLLPHAFQDANAYFDDRLNAVLFGYFTADRDNPGPNLPGQPVFTCLSHDIIAHEVTHAVTHRLREYFLEPTNPDVLAFHEAFADIVAIFQHFTFPSVLRRAIADTRGELRSPSTLVGLASQFGHATGRGGALRSALDNPDARRYASVLEPHERGSILVAAVFEAFFELYQLRIRPLIRIATEGRGILPAGDLHPELVDQLAHAAAGAAQEILTMCIRAFEYLPPVDITFGDYLRALVTADFDLVAEQNIDGRRALIEAFRRRGIFPEQVISLAEESLRWPPAADIPAMPDTRVARTLIGGASLFAATTTEGIEAAEDETDWHDIRAWSTANAVALGLDPNERIRPQGLHATYRVAPSGRLVVEIVAQFTQTIKTIGDPAYGGLPRRGGTTVVMNVDGSVRFAIAKPLGPERDAALRAYVAQRAPADLVAREGRGGRARASLEHLHRGLLA